MKNTIPEFDDYVANAREFARPILEKIRRAAHSACPEIQEVMKWSCPHFESDGLVAGMAAHKNHVSFRFWKGELLEDAAGVLDGVGATGMRGMKLESTKDVPAQKVMVALFKAAVELNRDGVKSAKKAPAKKRPAPAISADLAAALKKNKKARVTYEGFSPSHKREYVEWITEAKREATRAKRLAQTIEWLADGKPRNWKYMNR